MIEGDGLIDYIHDYIGVDAEEQDDSFDENVPFSYKMPINGELENGNQNREDKHDENEEEDQEDEKDGVSQPVIVNASSYLNNFENIFYGGIEGRAISVMNDCDKKSDDQEIDEKS